MTASLPDAPASGSRLVSLDALRGLVMALMLVDHVREFFFLHAQVADPMDLSSTPPALFATRLASHLCAPVFVFLTGLGAWLQSSRPHPHRRPGDLSRFLLIRGLLLIVLEITLVNMAWTFQWPPALIYLQVIWAIGVSMLALAVLLHLPYPLQLATAALILLGHNSLDALHFAPTDTAHLPWAILHDRGLVTLPGGMQIRTSYPVLPWIGVMLLGYTCGPLYRREASCRARWLNHGALVCLASFVVLRFANVYGDRPWMPGDTLGATLMAFLNVTKYPPSLLFLLLTLGIAAWLLARLEGSPSPSWALPGRALFPRLATFGQVPLFFYLVHLVLLQGLYQLFLACFGSTHGARFGFDALWQVWALAALTLGLLYGPCRLVGHAKQHTRAGWIRYF